MYGPIEYWIYGLLIAVIILYLHLIASYLPPAYRSIPLLPGGGNMFGFLSKEEKQPKYKM